MAEPKTIPEVWDAAVAIAAAIKAVPEAIRLDALAIALDGWIRTNGHLTVEALDARRR